jgi:hypothetical protein
MQTGQKVSFIDLGRYVISDKTTWSLQTPGYIVIGQFAEWNCVAVMLLTYT